MNKSVDTRAVDDYINSGRPSSCREISSNFTDPRHRVPDEHHHPHYLSQGFTVSLDVVGSPGHRQWFPAICHRFQPLTIKSRSTTILAESTAAVVGMIGVEGVDILAGGQNIWVTNRSPPGPGMTYSPSNL